MHLLSMFVHSIKTLRYRGVRSWLTVLGIIVGISSVVILVGLVDGLKGEITKQLESFGTRTLVVVPIQTSSGFTGPSQFLPTSGKLFEKDVKRLKRIAAIESIAKIIMGRTFIVYKDNEITASVNGVDPEIFKQTVGSLEVESGRFLQPSDKKSVVVGYDIAKEGFDQEVQLGSSLNISGQQYRVVGILKKTGNSVAQLDSLLFINFDEARDLFVDQLVQNEVSGIRLTVKEEYDMQEAEQLVNLEMLSSHRVTEDEKDFGIISPQFIGEQINSITSILSVFLGAVAGVSLIVGGIGISNTMFMSVLERRKEIGTLKSLGTTSDTIMRLFLIEASLIGLLGGILGIIVAFGLSFLITAISGINFAISIPLLVFAIIFSALVGIVSGVFPARSAAQLDPIEALRYE